MDGKFDEWKVLMREQYWGKPADGARDGVKEEEGSEGVEKAKVNGFSSDKSDDGKEIKDSEEGESEL